MVERTVSGISRENKNKSPGPGVCGGEGGLRGLGAPVPEVAWK